MDGRGKPGHDTENTLIAHAADGLSACRAIAGGGGAGGAALPVWPLGGIAAGGAAAVAAVEGGLPGSTTTRVPTFTRV